MAPFRRFRSLVCLFTLTTALVACQPQSDRPEIAPPLPEDLTESDQAFHLNELSYSDLSGWKESDLRPAMLAFQRQCQNWQALDPEKSLSNAAAYAGKVKDWLPACSVFSKYMDVGEHHRFFEDYFRPFDVESFDGINKLTGYYEPEISVRTAPNSKFSKAIPRRPDDLIEVKLGLFDPEYEGKTVWGKVYNGQLKLYPARADIETHSSKALGYADPADVFFLQIQGSGRLRFPDGRIVRAGFDSHNHRPFGSLANYLIQTGEIKRSEASMQGIRNWMKRVGPDRAEAAMNVNPRFVFFKERIVQDINEGPVGSAGIPLTPLGSVAVDLTYHPHGMPLFLETHLPNASSNWKGSEESILLIAQDTGGAIKGVKRGDIFFGSGDDAGKRAGRMNYEGRFVVLLPQELSVEAHHGRS